MLKIAICDDESVFLDELSRIIGRCLKNIEPNYVLDLFHSGKELLDCIEQDARVYHLLFLDIRMDEMTGMDLAHKIREMDENAIIVFTTSLPEYSLQGYEVRALQYLLKPVREEQVQKVLQYTLTHTKDPHDEMFALECEPRKWRKMRPKDIFYVETEGRRQAIRLENEVIYYRGKMSELLVKLPPDIFVRCHQSFLVNINQVVELGRGEALLKNKMRVPVSRGQLVVVQKAFLNVLSSEP